MNTEERYRIDPYYRAFVDAMAKTIFDFKLTPEELKDAVTIAGKIAEKHIQQQVNTKVIYVKKKV